MHAVLELHQFSHLIVCCINVAPWAKLLSEDLRVKLKEPVACGTLLWGAGVNDEGSFGFEDTVYLPKTLSNVFKARASLWFKVMEYLLHSRDEFQSYKWQNKCFRALLSICTHTK